MWKRPDVSKRNRNRVFSDGMRRKISEAHKKSGHKPPIFNRNHTEETRIKMSLSHRNMSEETRKKMSNGHKDIKRSPFSEEHRKNMSKSQKGKYGEKNPNWKGGITPKNHLIRNSDEFENWRKSVFERDNYTCRKCNKRGGLYLHAHHIKSFAEYPELRFRVSNGITLCEDCHRKTDNYGNKARYITEGELRISSKVN
ncbi:hypothetical protein ES705_34298 [subsurface metagenome]